MKPMIATPPKSTTRQIACTTALAFLCLLVLLGCDENTKLEFSNTSPEISNLTQSECEDEADSADAPTIEESLDIVAIDVNTLKITHNHAYYQCGARLNVTAVLSGQNLTVTEKDEADMEADCMCRFTLTFDAEVPDTTLAYQVFLKDENGQTRVTGAFDPDLLACETNADCANASGDHVACDGSWQCRAGECNYVCDENRGDGDTCTSDVDCGANFWCMRGACAPDESCETAQDCFDQGLLAPGCPGPGYECVGFRCLVACQDASDEVAQCIQACDKLAFCDQPDNGGTGNLDDQWASACISACQAANQIDTYATTCILNNDCPDLDSCATGGDDEPAAGEPECETISDCEAANLPHPECEGGWNCDANLCQWVCD
jgi:hypothetical protein